MNMDFLNAVLLVKAEDEIARLEKLLSHFSQSEVAELKERARDFYTERDDGRRRLLEEVSNEMLEMQREEEEG